MYKQYILKHTWYYWMENLQTEEIMKTNYMQKYLNVELTTILIYLHYTLTLLNCCNLF